MKNNNRIIILSITVAVLFLCAGSSLAQLPEEKAEKTLGISLLERPTLRTYSTAAVFVGYDNNVLLTQDRKGAIFEEMLYSFGLTKRLDRKTGITFNYDLDYLNYNSSVSATDMLNHMRLTLHRKYGRIQTGIGYDFSYTYFPNDGAGDFFFHKGYVYLRNFLTSRLYHQVLAEYGYKPHVSRKALADTINTYQDKTQTETRPLVEYLIVYKPTTGLSMDFRARCFKNDANDRYLDFYDYRAYELSPGVKYILDPRTELVANLIYLHKGYKDRTVTNASDKTNDNIYSANFALRYKLNPRSIASLNYGYRNNSTNDALQGYNENIISLGLQYDF